MFHKRSRFLALGALTASVLLAACSDSPIAPSAPLAPEAAQPAVLTADYVNISAQFGWLPVIKVQTSPKGNGTEQKFTLDPTKGGLVTFGQDHHLVVYPWAICDPNTSGYGVKLWLAECRQATKPINFKITTFTTAQGRPGASVEPDVRFVPYSLVRLYFHDSALTSFGKLYIPWCNTSGVCVDEGKGDDWQTTYYARGTPGYWVYRNLRHFSSYIVAY